MVRLSYHSYLDRLGEKVAKKRREFLCVLSNHQNARRELRLHHKKPMQCRKKFASEPADTPPSAAYRTANDFTSVVRQRGFYYTTPRRSQVPRLRFRIADCGLRIVNRAISFPWAPMTSE